MTATIVNRTFGVQQSEAAFLSYGTENNVLEVHSWILNQAVLLDLHDGRNRLLSLGQII